MSILFVKDLVFYGSHGVTGRETIDQQRFNVNIEIELNTLTSESSDALSDTYDYKIAERIAKQIIEGTHNVLIEKLAATIGNKICEHPKVQSAEVTITKLDAHSDGKPGIKIRKKRIIQEQNSGLLDFDIHKAIQELEKYGGTSFPILTDDYRKELLAFAETCTFIKQEEIVGPYKVREQLSSVKPFPTNTIFNRLAEDFQKLFLRKLEKAGLNIFSTPLNLDQFSLQLYEQGSIGITPHKDFSDQINMITNFMLIGHAKVATCDDREGNNPHYLDTIPGNITILRAPGFMNSDIRPFHFVTDVTERRIIFGLRQKK